LRLAILKKYKWSWIRFVLPTKIKICWLKGSANRAGTLPPSQGGPSTVATKKNPNMNLTFTGNTEISITGATLSMRAAPSSDSPNSVSHGQLWMFCPVQPSEPGAWTIHNLSMGESSCLERMDTSIGTLKMTTLSKGKVTQKWYIETTINGSVSVSSI
jgi:hypothetical protein